MELAEARQKFIHSWGVLGSNWGINKTMAQIHALLLISNEPISTEDIMEELQISRGNTNMNVRTLMDWGIVTKEHKIGEWKYLIKGYTLTHNKIIVVSKLSITGKLIIITVFLL